MRGVALRLLAVLLSVALISCDRTETYVDMLGSADSQVRRTAALRLLMRGKPVVPRLLEVLQDAPDSTRYIVVQLLGKIGDARAAPVLVGALRGERDVHVREEIVTAMGKLGDHRTVDALAKVLRDDEVAPIRAAAARSLANLHAPVSCQLLEQAFDDPDPTVRKEVLLGLLRLQFESLYAKLVQASRDSSATIRYIAVQLLDRYGGESAAAPLIHALHDDNGPVREEAARALGRLKSKAARPHLIDLMTRSGGADGQAAREALERITGERYILVD